MQHSAFWEGPCRAGKEAYNAIDMEDLNEILHDMWVCKCVANTKALILTAGQVLTYGIQSNIRDLEYLYQQYGFEVLKFPFKDIFLYMDQEEGKNMKPERSMFQELRLCMPGFGICWRHGQGKLSGMTGI